MPRQLRPGVLLLMGVLAGALPASSEQQPSSFEAASVKPSSARRDRAVDLSPGGRFAARNATLRDLVQLAYPLPSGNLRIDSQIVGGPTWINSDQFDVVAKAEGMPAGLDARNTGGGAVTARETTAIDQVRLMLRMLLADRFRLTTHNEVRQLPVLRLVKARKDGRAGLQLQPTDVDCAALRAAPQKAGQSPCGGFRALEPGHIVGRAVTMSMLAKFLEGRAGNIVTDSTDMTGKFDVDLRWAPDQIEQPERAVDPNAPSLSTALQEQLGLKFESARAPVDVLVIDHVEKPTPD